MNVHTKCLLCNSHKLKKLSGYYEKHSLIRCRSCGFVFMEKIPSAEELDAHYSRYSYASQGYLSPLTVKSYNNLLDEFEKYRKTNKILDVGCGRGWFLEQAKKRNWEVYGTEYSQTAVKICEDAGIRMLSGPLSDDSFEAHQFDVVTSFEVIEHINNPFEELSNIHRFLRTGGLFYCTTPNFNSLMRYYLKADYNVIGYPEHLSYYTKKTLNDIVGKCGFRPVKFLSTGISLTRIATSKKRSGEKLISEGSADEKLRQNISKKWYMSMAKRWANYMLTVSNLGMSLKGYYEKK